MALRPQETRQIGEDADGRRRNPKRLRLLFLCGKERKLSRGRTIYWHMLILNHELGSWSRLTFVFAQGKRDTTAIVQNDENQDNLRERRIIWMEREKWEVGKTENSLKQANGAPAQDCDDPIHHLISIKLCFHYFFEIISITSSWAQNPCFLSKIVRLFYMKASSAI